MVWFELVPQTAVSGLLFGKSIKGLAEHINYEYQSNRFD
jgi:hypothetical protein